MQIETTGTLHGLARKIWKIGGEHIVFTITCRYLEQWNRLVRITEGNVKITLEAAQGDLDLDGEGGVGDGEGEEDPDPAGNGDPPRRRTRKEPTGRHAVRDEGPHA